MDGRYDTRGHEQQRRRPSTVLSGEDVHDNELMIVSWTTKAAERTTSRDLLVAVESDPPFDEPSVADVQQLWTFPTGRYAPRFQHKSGVGPWYFGFKPKNPDDVELVPTLLTDSQNLLHARIARYFRDSMGTFGRDSPDAAGKVVWLDLVAPQRKSVEQTDLGALDTFFQHTMNRQWPYRATRLPCVIVGTWLASTSAERESGVYPLITVVPVVYEPEFQRAHPTNPKVNVRGFPGTSPFVLSALTQLTLTVDARQYIHEARRRVYRDDGPVSSFCVSREECDAIVKELARFVGVSL